MLAVGGLIYQQFWTRKKKNRIIQIFNRGTDCLQNQSHKFYKEWWNRNTVKILFCIVKFVKFSIKDVKMTKKKKKKKWLPYQYLAPYNTREED